MKIIELSAPPTLADVIAQVRIFEGSGVLSGHQRVFPSGEIEIVVSLTGAELRCLNPRSRETNRIAGAVAAGVQEQAILVEAAQLRSLLSIRFQPGGAWRLLGVPATHYRDRHVELAELVGRDSRDLTERLAEQTTHVDRLRVLESMWASRVRREPHPAIAWAVGQISRFPSGSRVLELAEEAGLSRRRFNDLFQREVGTNPKTFARIRRFQSTLRALRRSWRHGWGALAFEQGYADQSHLIREFQTFSGLTPGEFVKSGASGI